MVELINDCADVERLIRLVASNQMFAQKADKLTTVINKNFGYMAEELSEYEFLDKVVVMMPEVPKYKLLKDL